ncbi:MAG: glycosyltransferase [Omnitrophica bacterium]|nr:glycosyltransferase [Candidatus Omnitrophota bacterium]
MRCPTLKELPPPPEGKTGWPWTEESSQLPDVTPKGKPWPKITVVTPNYNYAQFIEETMRSVLLQGYPNLEYIILDGGSTDASIEIIKKYEPWLAHWRTEPDEGQTDAINKGFVMAKGTILAWINSDDIYYPDAFKKASVVLEDNPELALVHGDIMLIDENSALICRWKSHKISLQDMLMGSFIQQTSSFFRKAAIESIGYLDKRLQYVMDYDLWLKIITRYPNTYIPEVLGCARQHEAAKTGLSQYKYWEELIELLTDFSDQSISKAYLDKALGFMHMMAGFTYLRVNETSKVVEHFRAAIAKRFFTKKTARVVTSWTMGFLSSSRDLGNFLTEIEQLEMRLKSLVCLPSHFWKALYAARELKRADEGFKQKNRKAVCRHIFGAFRLTPSLVLKKYFWRLVIFGLLGPKVLVNSARLKKSFFIFKLFPRC